MTATATTPSSTSPLITAANPASTTTVGRAWTTARHPSTTEPTCRPMNAVSMPTTGPSGTVGRTAKPPRVRTSHADGSSPREARLPVGLRLCAEERLAQHLRIGQRRPDRGRLRVDDHTARGLELPRHVSHLLSRLTYVMPRQWSR